MSYWDYGEAEGNQVPQEITDTPVICLCLFSGLKDPLDNKHF